MATDKYFPSLDEIQKIEIYHDGENIIPLSNLSEVERIIKTKILKEISDEEFPVYDNFDYRFYYPNDKKDQYTFKRYNNTCSCSYQR